MSKLKLEERKENLIRNREDVRYELANVEAKIHDYQSKLQALETAERQITNFIIDTNQKLRTIRLADTITQADIDEQQKDANARLSHKPSSLAEFI
jgi:chromosome segregation ATPase